MFPSLHPSSHEDVRLESARRTNRLPRPRSPSSEAPLSSDTLDSILTAAYCLATVAILLCVIVFHIEVVGKTRGVGGGGGGGGVDEGGIVGWEPSQDLIKDPAAPPQIADLPDPSLVIEYDERPPTPSSFVRVRGRKFMVGCRPFYVSGFNAHELIEISMLHPDSNNLHGGLSGKHRVREVFRQASGNGINVIRTWAHTLHETFEFQTAPGDYNEKALRGLDFVLNEARLFGIRASLSFIDNWKYLNGIDMFVDWSTTAPERTQKRPPDTYDDPEPVDDMGGYEAKRHALFFTDPDAMKLYKDHVAAIINRTNHLTGRRYRDDPTIFAWELANEPRCNVEAVETCTQDVQAWIEEMSAHVKKLDPNHLVTVGTEGFYCGDKQWRNKNPGRWAEEVGQCFTENHAVESIDFAAIHSWPEHWERPDLEFTHDWITSHMSISRTVLKKPLLMTEFGKRLEHRKQNSGQHIEEIRDPVYNVSLRTVEHGIRREAGISGIMFWRLKIQTYADDLGRGRYGVLPEDSTFKYIQRYSAAIQSLMHSRAPHPACQMQCWVPYTESGRRLCVSEPQLCTAYWNIQKKEGKFKDLGLNDVAFSLWDDSTRLSNLKFFSSWWECCRPGLGAFYGGCTLGYGYPTW